MNREEILNELLKKVMIVVEANKYNLASGVRDWNVPYTDKERMGDTYPSDFYVWDLIGIHIKSNEKSFIWRSYQDRVAIYQNKETGECGIDVNLFNPDKIDKFPSPDRDIVKQKGAWDEYTKSGILESDEIYEKVTNMLGFLLNAFTYKYDDVKDDVSFTSRLSEITKTKLADSKVGGHIDTYIKKIAHAIENNAQLKGYDYSLNQEEDIIIGLPEVMEINGWMDHEKQSNENSGFVSSIDASGYFLPSLTYKAGETGHTIHTTVPGVIARIYPESVINYEGKTNENSSVLNELLQMRLYDMLYEYTLGLNENATLEDVANTIFWRSKYSRVDEELASKLNATLEGRGEIFPTSQIINNTSKTM